MKKEMLDSLNHRFSGVERNETLVLATPLDPCFNDKFIFNMSLERDEAKSLLIEKICDSETLPQQSIELQSEEPPEKCTYQNRNYEMF